MSWNNVIPAEVFVDAPKSTRGRKPSKWQLHNNTGVDDGINIIYFDNAKQAKAVVAYARAFGYIPNDPRDD
jgi:hypothetical protein